MTFYCKMSSPVGELTIAGEGESLTGLWLEEQRYFKETLDPLAREGVSSVLEQTKGWLSAYFEGKRPAGTILLAPRGSLFRQAVWRALLEIPYGTVTTYGELARCLAGKSGKPVSARAVGGAVAHNPISILIPCHRVIGAKGNLTGYAGGLTRKRQILALEQE